MRKKYIIRKGYHRRAYTRKDGVKVKATYVQPTKILDLGTPGHGKDLGIKLKKGLLSNLGYSIDKSRTDRRKALRKAVKLYGSLSTQKKLNLIATYHKRTNPKISKKFKEDYAWVKRTFN